MQAVQLIALAVLPALAIIAALGDLAAMRIPNWISAVVVVSFFPVALLMGLAPMGVAVHLGMGLLVLAITLGLFAIGQIGGGDAKLMSAMSVWFGAGLGPYMFWTAMIGGVFTLLIVLARTQAQPYVAAMPGWAANLMTPKKRITYGVAIGGGALAAFPTSPLVQAWLAGG